MPDVPAEVNYGQVTGRFVRFLADSTDVGTAPDEIALTGTARLTPLVPLVRWPTATPPRMAVVETLVCPIIDGWLCPPDSTTADVTGVWVIATDQPDGQPDTVQWRAQVTLTGVSTQPAAVVFNVPTNGVVDLATTIPASIEPPTVVVVSHEDLLAAQQAAADAQAAAASVPSYWTGTQAEYDALLSINPATFYYVTA